MMTQARWVLAAILFVSVPLDAQDRDTVISQVLENSFWRLESIVVQYESSELEDLVGDDIREIEQYGARGAARFQVNRGSETVEVTLYEMIDSAGAYGLFALTRDWTRRDFQTEITGTESFRQDDDLVFWQSNYVGRLAGSFDETAVLARVLTDYIMGGSRKAPVSNLLPPEGLVTESEKYILTPETLEESAGLDPTYLGFENSVEVALAEYRADGDSAQLALFLYPTQQLANRQLEAWIASQDQAPPHRRTGPLLAIVTASESPGLTDSILTGVYYQSEITWNEPLPDPLTLPYMILTIFTWIGIALFFTLVAGVGFGGLRIYMKTRYPGFVFGSEESDKLIQLDIYQRVNRKELNR